MIFVKNKRKMKKIIMGIGFSSCFLSCIKKQEIIERKACYTNCRTIVGKVMNKQTEAGIATEIELKTVEGGFFSSESLRGIIVSKPDGTFSTEMQEFGDYHRLKCYHRLPNGSVVAVFPYYAKNDTLLFKL
jgi:hypothetical protein